MKTAIKVALILIAFAAAAFAPDTKAEVRDWDSPDLAKHFKYSTVFGVVGVMAVQDPLYAFGGCVAIGATKELLDELQDGNKADWQDMTANAVGCATGVLLADQFLKVVASDEYIGIQFDFPF